MKSDFLKKIGKSVLRITAALVIILGITGCGKSSYTK